MSRDSQVVCICGGYGYPQGSGGAARITLVGKALQAAGIQYRLLHCGPSPLPINTERSGVHDGIPFQYTTWLARPKNLLARWVVYARALAGLALSLVRLWPARQHTAIYLYVMSGPLNIYVSSLCRLLGLPVVQELCEWWPGEPSCPALTRWLYRRRIFAAASGMVVISKAIERRARERAAALNPDLRIYRLTTLVDFDRFACAPPEFHPAAQGVPNFLWCGSMDGWLKDVLFLLRVFAELKQRRRCQLTIVGTSSERSRNAVLKYAAECGVSIADPDELTANVAGAWQKDVLLRGWVDDDVLPGWFQSATALLLPMWDDDRSRTRLPQKLAEYLASGRPVVTARVGDLTDFLADGVNAFVAEPGDEADFTDRLISILDDPTRAEWIGAAGRKACAAHLDYRVYRDRLAEFFLSCIHRHGLVPAEKQAA